MPLQFTRVAMNMCGIGGTISTGAFGFSLASSKWSVSKVNRLSADYSRDLKIEAKDINSINDIEDYEQLNGCKFLFYKTGSSSSVFQNGDFQVARNTSVPDFIKKARENAINCQKGSFVFINETTTEVRQATAK